MSHQEKQSIFDRYANSKGYESFFEIIHDYAYLGKPNEILNHCFAVCDLVQEEQRAISLDAESFLSCKFSYSFWTELFKNHFNVFQLPESEYINKAKQL